MCWVTGVEGSTGHFAELTLAECEKLLAEHKAGRVGLNAPAGPQILPVTYAYYAKTIVFRTSPYGVLSSLGRHTRVAFEIDNIDEERESGWSVLVLGSAERVTREYTLTSLWKDGPVPWAEGTRNLFIMITPETITGRAVRLPSADGPRRRAVARSCRDHLIARSIVRASSCPGTPRMPVVESSAIVMIVCQIVLVDALRKRPPDG